MQRNHKMECQIDAPIKETMRMSEEQHQETDKSIASAVGLREKGLFFFIRRR